MPPTSLVGIPHSVATDHRILAWPQSGFALEAVRAAPGEPLNAVGLQAEPADLRTRALAYAQVSRNFPAYRREGFQLLRQASDAYPDDLDVQQTYGLIQQEISSDPRSMLAAARALQRAVELGSLSARVHFALARIRLRAGQQASAVDLLQKAVKLEPHFVPAARLLARLYLESGEEEKARQLAERVLKYVPSDEYLRGIIQ